MFELPVRVDVTDVEHHGDQVVRQAAASCPAGHRGSLVIGRQVAAVHVGANDGAVWPYLPRRRTQASALRRRGLQPQREAGTAAGGHGHELGG